MTTTAPRSVVLSSGRLRLEVLTSGASVRRLVVEDPVDGPVDVVLGHADPRTYVGGGGYLGATIGRFTNRLDRGRAVVDGTVVRVPPNDGGNALHGGPVGFDAREWTLLDADGSHATLSLTSPDGDQGLPGTVEARVGYAVDGDEVTITHRATTDRPTYLGLTNHAYLNLEGEGSGDVLDHRLEVAASAWTPVRADLVPTGEVAAVDGTPFDLRRSRRLGDVLAEPSEQLAHGGGLDHNLVLDGSGMRCAATLVAPSGRWLEVHTDRPALQVYTGAHFDGSISGLSGRTYRRCAGVALETQGYPDAPNHAGFPDAVLRPGQVFSSVTRWRLGRH
ncbi:aldose epimerase family protein [Phycicoccus sonneratiae]|uniref:Aldose 1-epimerase n=1 Tax=Phycicoccus sonneratiae TaxID=2807628 RepID=A0ABS2CQX4_9MICO|nr:aldose epimerase family protein [Phycicoccus sonneraticus]MBM6402190.1 galactose mutarotase [Phycicoccus sonneraticus]